MISPPQSSTSAILSDDVWPPGFRFHPTDEELILYYLKRKICRRKLKLDIIAEVDVYKWEPEELPELSSLKNGDRQWFFFSPRDRKYPNCSRANRATKQGYWKTTGKDRTITCNSRDVGVKKTLVFYRGRAPTGQRTDWVMHEYTLEEDELKRCPNVHDYYVINKMFKKSGPGPKNGEQYGAPFREEDWVDDNFVKNSRNCDQVNCDQQEFNVSPAENCKSAKVDILKTGTDEFLNNSVVEVDDHALLPNLDNLDLEQALSQFLGEDETRSMINAPVGEPFYVEPCLGSDFGAGQMWGAAESTSAVDWGFMPEATAPTILASADRQLAVNDFLELDDLLGPESIQVPSTHSQPTIDIHENVPLRNGGFDLYHDAGFFLGDFGPNDQTFPPAPYPTLQEDGFSNQAEMYPYSSPTVGNETVNYGSHSYLHNPTEASTSTILVQPPGVTHPSVSESLAADSNKSGNETQSQDAQQWLSSTLWSFVESIPAAPASAAETVLANKAFKRLSSFSRVRITSQRTVTVTGGGVKSEGTGFRGTTKGFLVFSFLVALFAVVCVFFGSQFAGNLHSRINL